MSVIRCVRIDGGGRGKGRGEGRCGECGCDGRGRKEWKKLFVSGHEREVPVRCICADFQFRTVVFERDAARPAIIGLGVTVVVAAKRNFSVEGVEVSEDLVKGHERLHELQGVRGCVVGVRATAE